ncbi:hypothetical protein [Pseudomonas sp. SDO52101_S400]
MKPSSYTRSLTGNSAQGTCKKYQLLIPFSHKNNPDYGLQDFISSPQHYLKTYPKTHSKFQTYESVIEYIANQYKKLATFTAFIENAGMDLFTPEIK